MNDFQHQNELSVLLKDLRIWSKKAFEAKQKLDSYSLRKSGKEKLLSLFPFRDESIRNNSIPLLARRLSDVSDVSLICDLIRFWKNWIRPKWPTLSRKSPEKKTSSKNRFKMEIVIFWCWCLTFVEFYGSRCQEMIARDDMPHSCKVCWNNRTKFCCIRVSIENILSSTVVTKNECQVARQRKIFWACGAEINWASVSKT